MRTTLRSMFGSRFGFRVVGTFVLCALAPLAVASGVLLAEFSKLLEQRDQRDVNSIVRGFGMGVVGRLAGADDVLSGLIKASGPSGDDGWVDDQVRRLSWVEAARRVDGAATPSSPAREAFARGDAVLVWRFDETATAAVTLIRRLASGSALEVELKPEWLWGDFLELGDEANLLLLDDAGRTLAARGRRARELAHGHEDSAASDGWVVSRWELFLRGRFHAPSWRLIVFKPRRSVTAGLFNAGALFPATIVLTLLLVCLLSLRLIRRQLRPLETLVEGTRKISRLEFDQPVELAGNDEFADLAKSFNGMSERLRRQFSALEALSEIDRLLLRSPRLETILDSVLPRMAAILGCSAVSVVLIDVDAEDHGRSYDFTGGGSPRLPVRRLTTEIGWLRRATAGGACVDVSVLDACLREFAAPLAEACAQRYRICALRHDGRISGFLCAGFKDLVAPAIDSSVRTDDFADRLSVVLANLERTERLYEQAHYDPLTRLPNRQHFRENLGLRLSRADGQAGRGALFYIDLDQFKHINDTAGHTTGDDVLCAVARRLEACFTSADIVARLGGDEFAAIVQSAASAESIRQLAQRVLDSLRTPLPVGGREYRIEASIGITLFPDDGGTIEELLKNSDIAMYRAKESGRGRVVFFEPAMQERMRVRAALESGLHRALEHQEFRLLYQPIVDGASARMTGVEALIRWPSAPDRPARSPAVFIPVAEESDLIVDIGAWVLEAACRQFNAWRIDGLDIRYVSVNVSARQLRNAGFVDLVLGTVKDHDIRPGELQLEITEGALAEGPVVARALEELAMRGVQLALDDFGTGYSSLSYLRDYPIHSVKIDRSFITETPANRAACRLVESIIAMTTALEKHVVAEGVETEAQLRFLQAAGCGSIQGYLLGKPLQASEIGPAARSLRANRLLFDGMRSTRRLAAGPASA